LSLAPASAEALFFPAAASALSAFLAFSAFSACSAFSAFSALPDVPPWSAAWLVGSLPGD